MRWFTTLLIVLAPGISLAEDVSDKSLETVGRTGDGRAVTPVNQILTPYGKQVELPGLRPQVLALSPDGKLLITAGKTNELIVINPVDGSILQRVSLPNEGQLEPPADVVSPAILLPDKTGQISYTGLIFSPDGRRIYLSNVNGSIKVFAISENGEVRGSYSLPLPEAGAPRRKPEIPAGLALSADGATLFVCGNLSNRLLEIDATNGAVRRTFEVGVAPYDVVLVGQKAYVSNWGGRRPGNGDLTGPAGRGTTVRVDAVRHIANEGTVSVISLTEGNVVREIPVGLHPSDLAISPDGKQVVVANSSSDNLSVISVATDEVLDTIWMKPNPADLLQASPNAIAFSDDGETLFVANGTQNAIGVVEFKPETRGESKLKGLIPVNWYPGAVVFDASRNSIYAANIKGLPSEKKRQNKIGPLGFNSHHHHGSVSLVPLPSAEDLPKLSERAARNLRAITIAESRLPPRQDQPPRAIPERIGEPSLIKHVVYVIKENRTYDQVFGALGRGNGDPTLCVFGREFTPNQHKMVDDFVLLDNTYCCGILSADGHQWSSAAFATDYLEKSFAGFPRSYPDGMGADESDALSYSPAGFLWDSAVQHKVSIRNYGEFMMPNVRWRDPARKGDIDFRACFQAWKGINEEVVFGCEPAIESVRPFSPLDYVGWNMSVPDQFRADFFLKELAEFEERGEFPQLTIICLPNDHTSGTSRGCPTPAATVADNDLAFGRIVAGLSRSRFWKEMAILGIEDDPQAGWDHVSGYRTTAYCVSPYARRQTIVSTQYNSTSVIRTIEQILGLPPLNGFDASATPLFDCFTDTANLAPFQSLPSNVPLDQMNPEPAAINDPILREDAKISSTLNFREVDHAPENVLNRILWRAMRGSSEPYPEWAVSEEDDD